MKETDYIMTEYSTDDGTVIGEITYSENKIMYANIFAEYITSKKEIEDIEKLIKLIKMKEWRY